MEVPDFPSVDEFKKLSLEEKSGKVGKAWGTIPKFYDKFEETDLEKLDPNKFGNQYELKYIILYDAYLDHTRKTQDIRGVAKKTPEELKKMIDDEFPILKHYMSQCPEDLQAIAYKKMEDYIKANGIPRPKMMTSGFYIQRHMKNEKAREEFLIELYEKIIKKINDFKAINGKYGLPKPVDILNSKDKNEVDKSFIKLLEEMRKNGEKIYEIPSSKAGCNLYDMQYTKLYDVVAAKQKPGDLPTKEDFLKIDNSCVKIDELEKLRKKAVELGITTEVTFPIEEVLEAKKENDSMSVWIFEIENYIRLTRGF